MTRARKSFYAPTAKAYEWRHREQAAEREHRLLTDSAAVFASEVWALVEAPAEPARPTKILADVRGPGGHNIVSALPVTRHDDWVPIYLYPACGAWQAYCVFGAEVRRWRGRIPRRRSSRGRRSSASCTWR